MPWRDTPVQTIEQPLGFSDGVIRFVWLTDAADATYLPTSNLRKAIADLNTWRPNALVLTGDIANNTTAGTLALWNVINTAQRPVFWAIGNHDEEEITLGEGVPNTVPLQGFTAWNQVAPFWKSTQWASGDSTFKARVLVLDGNFYDDDPDDPPPGDSANHEPGDRIGYHTTEPAGGFSRQWTQVQADWVAAELTADSDSDAVLILSHLPPVSVTDPERLADVLQADGRPALGFCGHVHEDGTSYTLTSTDTLATYTFYKAPGMSESGAWVRVSLSWNGSAMVVDALTVLNYTDPGGWTLNAPFTV